MTMIDTVLASVSNKVVNYINLNILFFQFAVGGKESTMKTSDIKMFTYHYVVNNKFETPPLIKSSSICKLQRWEENDIYIIGNIWELPSNTVLYNQKSTRIIYINFYSFT